MGDQPPPGGIVRTVLAGSEDDVLADRVGPRPHRVRRPDGVVGQVQP
jgi:hypothetical protein